MVLVAKVSQRLNTAAANLRQWSYLAEVSYTWLGVISLGVSFFAAYSRGGWKAFARPGVALGVGSVGLSTLMSLVGWFQARNCRSFGRQCSEAASALEPGGPAPQARRLKSVLPPITSIEKSLRSRQRTAWLGMLFAIVGLQCMAGVLVTKVLVTYGAIGSSSDVPLDVFTLLGVGNAALSHVIGAGVAMFQQSCLPAPAAANDPYAGWGRS